MGLQSAFELELSTTDDSLLDRIRKMITQQLRAATRTHRHPWHLGVVSTCTDGGPRVRTVVLRSVNEDPLKIRFHTDLRSRKISELQAVPRVEWLFYESSTRIQVRIGCAAKLATEGPDWEEAWAKTGLPSRRCYLGPYSPGDQLSKPDPNLPADLRDRNPTHEESEAGRINFAIVECQVERIEWLYLKHDGHLRCQFRLDEVGIWHSTWMAP